ncbi:hypothetical protein M0802_009753 [Mischocyttarus mexicanus]|nr:hypothetical protein M0802_009753 [Mischocyttarus mexicanus]
MEPVMRMTMFFARTLMCTRAGKGVRLASEEKRETSGFPASGSVRPIGHRSRTIQRSDSVLAALLRLRLLCHRGARSACDHTPTD